MGVFIVHYKGVTVYYFQLKLDFFCLNFAFVLANSADSGEMPYYVVFHINFPYLPKQLRVNRP